MKKTQIPMARKEGLVLQEMPDELLVYDLETNKAHCLNQTASTVWKACNGENTVGEIAKMFEGSNEDLVWLALDQLAEYNLLQKPLKSKFEGISRREMIKKVSITGAVALPIIAMLSFPTASLAVTCTASIFGTQGDCPVGQICCMDAGGPGTPACSAPGSC